MGEDNFTFRNEIIRIDVIVQAIRLNYIEQLVFETNTKKEEWLNTKAKLNRD